MLDGVPADVSYTSDKVMLVSPVVGFHTFCCQLTTEGAPVPGCDATSSFPIKVKIKCDGFDDSDCADGNPCSIDACTYTTEGYACHYGMDLEKPFCCTSDYDCGCTEDGWGTCDPLTATCAQ